LTGGGGGGGAEDSWQEAKKVKGFDLTDRGKKKGSFPSVGKKRGGGEKNRIPTAGKGSDADGRRGFVRCLFLKKGEGGRGGKRTLVKCRKKGGTTSSPEFLHRGSSSVYRNKGGRNLKTGKGEGKIRLPGRCKKRKLLKEIGV